MRRYLKWIGIGLGGLIGLVMLAALGLSLSANARLHKTYSVQSEAVTVSADPGIIEKGRRLAGIYCAGCHGENLAGTFLLNDRVLGRVASSNLTSGQGGVAGAYKTDADWVRAIRHGVGPDGKPFLGMPSNDFYHLNDDDLGAVIAYLKSLAPRDNELGGRSLKPPALALLAAGAFGEAAIPAEVIDHAAPRPPSPAPGATAEYGGYLVRTTGCRTCHGKELAGGPNPEPGAPPGPNLTPGGPLGQWSERDFISAVRTREGEYNMPWESLDMMTDKELRAVWLYLQSLPAREKRESR